MKSDSEYRDLILTALREDRAGQDVTSGRELPLGDRVVARSLLFKRCAAARDLTPLVGLPLFARLDGETVDIELRVPSRPAAVWPSPSEGKAAHRVPGSAVNAVTTE